MQARTRNRLYGAPDENPYGQTWLSGNAFTGSAVTDASGIATYQYRLKQKDPTGTYQASASASVNGLTDQGTTSVQVR